MTELLLPQSKEKENRNDCFLGKYSKKIAIPKLTWPVKMPKPVHYTGFNISLTLSKPSDHVTLLQGEAGRPTSHPLKKAVWPGRWSPLIEPEAPNQDRDLQK